MKILRGFQGGAPAAASDLAARLLSETTAGRDEGCYPETAAELDDGCFPNADAPLEGCFPERQRTRPTTSPRRA
jgi:hypothetical protein